MDGGEVVIAGGEGGFAPGGERDGETVGIGKLVISTKFGGNAREAEIGVNDFDGKLCNVHDDFAGDAGTMGAPGGIVDFAPADDGHKQLTIACDAKMDKLFDLVRARTVFEKSH